MQYALGGEEKVKAIADMISTIVGNISRDKVPLKLGEVLFPADKVALDTDAKACCLLARATGQRDNHGCF